MSKLRPRGISVELDGEERYFLFTLNMIDHFEEKYGKTMNAIIEDLVESEQNNHMLRDIVTDLLNDEAERSVRKCQELQYPEVTVQDTGNMIGLDNYYEVLNAVLRAYGISLPEAEEDDDPNRESGQTKG